MNLIFDYLIRGFSWLTLLSKVDFLEKEDSFDRALFKLNALLRKGVFSLSVVKVSFVSNLVTLGGSLTVKLSLTFFIFTEEILLSAGREL